MSCALLARAGILACVGLLLGCQTGPPVELTSGEDRIDVRIDGHHVTSYRYGRSLTKPVLFPVCTLSGVAVNRGFPLESVAGESEDHPHHIGVFFGYGNVNGADFWNNTTSPPQIAHVATREMAGGRGSGKLAVEHQWVGSEGRILLEEWREMTFLGLEEDAYAIDCRLVLRAESETVVLDDNKEGAFAIRVADWLKEDGGSGRYLSSNGDETAANTWGKRARWVRLQGEKDGRVFGIVILDHPESVNHPSYWHARGYGLFAVNPLGQFVFQRNREEPGARALRLTLRAGEEALFHYRLIVYEGERTYPELEQWFADFAEGR
ncbi:MAG: PmoA family protein [Planctomycetota bacterium]